MRKALVRLGKKNGVDYKPRVIAEVPKGDSVGHAVTIYEDGGVSYALDQNLAQPFSGIAEASVFFPSVKRANWMEVVTQVPGRTYRIPIKGSTLDGDYDRGISAEFGEEHFGQGFDTSTLPTGWNNYSSAVICFGHFIADHCAETAVFKRGVLDQVAYQSGDLAFEDYDAAGKIEARVYRAGKFRVVEYKNEKPVEAIAFTGEKVSL
jgi:hypothetical protein